MESNQPVTDFKKIITDSLAFNIFHVKDAFSENTDGKHISVSLFENPLHLKEITLRLLRIYLKQAKTKSVIGFTENDPSLTIFATQVSYIEKMPFYNYDLENYQSADNQFIEPENVPCSLIIPYSINESHVLEIIERFSQQKVPISQVISMVDENLSGTTISNNKIEFVSISNWVSLKDRISHFQNITNMKMDQMLSNFD
jgi:hypothetical protein